MYNTVGWVSFHASTANDYVISDTQLKMIHQLKTIVIVQLSINQQLQTLKISNLDENIHCMYIGQPHLIVFFCFPFFTCTMVISYSCRPLKGIWFISVATFLHVNLCVKQNSCQLYLPNRQNTDNTCGRFELNLQVSHDLTHATIEMVQMDQSPWFWFLKSDLDGMICSTSWYMQHNVQCRTKLCCVNAPTIIISLPVRRTRPKN